MKVFVPYLNSEYDLTLYDFSGNNGVIHHAVSHESLEYLLREVATNITCEIKIISATEKYAAVQVNVFDEFGRFVSDVADVSVEHLDTNSENMKNYLKAHPLVSAKNNAFDAAVRKFFNLPRVINTENEMDNSKHENFTENVKKTEVEKKNKENEEELLFGNPFSKEVFKSGAFAGCTYAQVWKISPEYLHRAKNWKGYETIKEFLRYMEEN